MLIAGVCFGIAWFIVRSVSKRSVADLFLVPTVFLLMAAGIDVGTSPPYQTEAMVAGGAHGYTLLLVVLTCAVVLGVFHGMYAYSYEHFQDGGGALTASVAAGLVPLASAAIVGLAVGYWLTVDVSISSGVDQALSIIHWRNAPWPVHVGLIWLAILAMRFIVMTGRSESNKIAAYVGITMVGLFATTVVVGLLSQHGIVGTPLVYEHKDGFAGYRDSLSGAVVSVTGVEAFSNCAPIMMLWTVTRVGGIQVGKLLHGRKGPARTMHAFWVGYGLFFLIALYLLHQKFGLVKEQTLVLSAAYAAEQQLGVFGKGLQLALGLSLVGGLCFASLIAFQDLQMVFAKAATVGFVPTQVTRRTDKEVFHVIVNITTVLTMGISLLVRGQTERIGHTYAMSVLVTICIMALSLFLFTYYKRELFGMLISIVGLITAGSVFSLQVYSNWHHGGIYILSTMALGIIAFHTYLMSPSAQRRAEELLHIFPHDLRGQVGPQVVAVQEYRNRLRAWVPGLSVAQPMSSFGFGNPDHEDGNSVTE